MMANESSTALEDHEDQVRPAKMAHFDQVANGYSFEAHTWPLPRRKQVIAYNFNLEHFFFMLGPCQSIRIQVDEMITF